jgi:hypothetical protein
MTVNISLRVDDKDARYQSVSQAGSSNPDLSKKVVSANCFDELTVQKYNKKMISWQLSSIAPFIFLIHIITRQESITNFM